MSLAVHRSRKDAVRQGALFYYTGKPCLRGHLCNRGVATGHCMECSRIKARNWAAKNKPYFANWQRQKRLADPVAARKAWRRGKLRSFGLSPEQYNALWESQNGECASCDIKLIEGKFTHVDHCHKSKVVRGILCHACNISIGLLKEDATRVRKVATYIEKWKADAP